MNRRNYTVHLALAASLVLLAAVVGRVSRLDWRGHFDAPQLNVRVETPHGVGGGLAPSEGGVYAVGPENNYRHEVFVRFRHGVSEERIQSIAARLHDRAEDEIE